MPTCFVIQPFDSGKFDKRFNDTFRPALEHAGLVPYRVDRDPSVQVTIASIEEGIRNATMCMADITTDNPNVWYELGFSLALGRDVILVCCDERKSAYPFDIQHRHVISYSSESQSDYDDLRQKITERAVALLDTEARHSADTDEDTPQVMLSHPEVVVLRVAAGKTTVPGERLLASALKHDVERSGVTDTACGAAVFKLGQRGFLRVFLNDEHEGYTCDTVTLTDDAWMWITERELLSSEVDLGERGDSEAIEDELPF